MSTATRPALPLLLSALACILSMTACRSVSTTPSVVRAEPPEVPCAQRTVDPRPPRAPRADEWVEYVPALSGVGAARLSAAAATWIIEVLGVVDKQRAVRAEEHRCLDVLQEKGLIRQ